MRRPWSELARVFPAYRQAGFSMPGECLASALLWRCYNVAVVFRCSSDNIAARSDNLAICSDVVQITLLLVQITLLRLQITLLRLQMVLLRVQMMFR